VGLIYFPDHPILKGDVYISATIYLPFEPIILFQLNFPELDAPPITVGISQCNPIQFQKSDQSDFVK